MTLEFNPSDLPFNSEITYNGSEISIIKETEKAFLLCYTRLVKRGTSKVSDRVEHTVWCPKSVWNNENNFSNTGHNHNPENGVVTFEMPYFMKK